MKYNTFYTISIDCEPNGEIPKTRGAGTKTYTYNSRSPKIKKIIEKIPEYEKIVETRIYQNEFPLIDCSIDEVTDCFSNCRRCTLKNNRRFIVGHRILFGRPNATGPFKVAIIGQCPGVDEDTCGMPFVGKSGRYLTELLTSVGYNIPTVVINVTGCTPRDGIGAPSRTENKKEEIIACSQRLWMTLQATKPKFIISVGRVPSTIFCDNPKAEKRGEFKMIGSGVYVAQTYHPAALLRRMSEGDQYSTLEFVELFKRLKEIASNVRNFYKDEKWYLLEEDFPFSFLKSVK